MSRKGHNVKENTILWLAWEKHRRTQELGRFLDVQPIMRDLDFPRVVRYPFLVLWSTGLLILKRPNVLIVQNPSVVLGILASGLKLLIGYRLIVDAHNVAIEPEGRFVPIVTSLQKFVQRSADRVIVTTSGLAKKVAAAGGSPLILPDRLPTPFNVKRQRLPGKSALFICTFGRDEPYDEVFLAASSLPDDVHLYVTGRLDRIPRRWIDSPPSNVEFVGFLPEKDYWSMLASVDLVIDLTTRENCLVCGAYEATSVGAPLLLSQTEALRSYFTGASFTGHSPSEIREAILDGISQSEERRKDVQKMREELTEKWKKLGEGFRCEVFGCQDDRGPSTQ